MSTQPGALPEGCVLVHIGPYKTGSTALQHSLAAHRDVLQEHGVWYPGPRYRHMRPGWAVTERSMRGVEPVPMAEWVEFADSVRDRPADRVVVSSEDFVLATEQQAGRIVSDLGAERVHVLLVARRLDRLLPSAWQERVKSSNETLTFDDFLAAVLDEGRSHASARSFWFNHDLGAILARWLPALPAERIHVVVADEDRAQLARVVEHLLALPEGLLAPAGRANVSLSVQRVGLVRRLNELFDAHGWSDRDRLNLIHRGLLPSIEAVPSGPGETSIPPIPPAARERLAELDRVRIDAVQVPGLDVIGDPAQLRSEPSSAQAAPAAEVLDLEVVARAVEGVVAARLHRPEGGRRTRRAPRPSPPAAEPSTVPTTVSSRELARELARRARRRLRPGRPR